MNQKKKALALVVPAFGHINLMCCIIKQLIKKKNIHVILYSDEKCKDLVLRSGAEYREFKNSTSPKDFNPDTHILDIFEMIMDATIKIFPELIEICNEEKPDLIICDTITLYGRYLINYLNKMHINQKLDYKLPKSVIVHSIFVFYFGIYPNFNEAYLVSGEFNFNILKKMAKISLKHVQMKNQFGLTYPYNPISFNKVLNSENHLQICGILQELQPKADSLIHMIKFVGCCIDDEVRNNEVKNDKLNKILNTFEPSNPIKLEEVKNDQMKKLIYASLGTVFNNHISVFDKIIEAFKTFDQDPISNLKSNDLELIISVGNAVYENFQSRINEKQYELPENILILPSVPQIEILKRASLFITHAGMNSTSETIHYGVPVICLPVMADQPLVARRICDELNFGKRFDFKKFTVDQMRASMHEVLSNKTYLENILQLTHLSRKTNGCENGANLIEEYLNG